MAHKRMHPISQPIDRWDPNKQAVKWRRYKDATQRGDAKTARRLLHEIESNVLGGYAS